MALTEEARLDRVMKLKSQFFSHRPSVCIEGALSKTEVFKATESEPMIIRRAKARGGSGSRNTGAWHAGI